VPGLTTPGPARPNPRPSTDLKGHYRVARLIALLVATTAFLVPSLETAAHATPDHFHPRPGVTFNSPLGDIATRREIFRKIIRSINSSPRGSEIKILSWNFLTRDGTDALLRAQSRGVTVRLLMSASNNSSDLPNHPFRRLKAGLRHTDKTHPKRPRSWARTCHGSCRGTGGTAHAKYFLFSRVGKVRHVVMQGSANLTLASTNNQWNDIVTHTRNRAVWRFASHAFHQAARDKPVKRPFLSRTFRPHRLGRFRLMMFPMGKTSNDPVMNLLDQVRCRNATNTASHHTVIRIAPDVIRTARGLALARKVRALWNRGCSIRIGYTVVGIDVGHLLRDPSGRGPVPMKHLVQDFNGDGEFDNYFHLKAMTIVGNVGGRQSGYVVLNGSANWSGLARVSDENLGIYWNKALTLRYQEHLDYWYKNFPKSKPTGTTTSGRTAFGTEPDQLVFGSGKNAIYEDGTPYSTTGVDPYAHLDRD
jgi:PLD-like domain